MRNREIDIRGTCTNEEVCALPPALEDWKTPKKFSCSSKTPQLESEGNQKVTSLSEEEKPAGYRMAGFIPERHLQVPLRNVIIAAMAAIIQSSTCLDVSASLHLKWAII